MVHNLAKIYRPTQLYFIPPAVIRLLSLSRSIYIALLFSEKVRYSLFSITLFCIQPTWLSQTGICMQNGLSGRKVRG